MKGIIFTFSVVFLLGVASCKKSYTCTCTDNYTGKTTTTSTVSASGKTSAQYQCAANGNPLNGVTCAI